MTMKISGFAHVLGVSSQTLRNYEKKGILVPNRLPSGYRIYNINHIKEAINLGIISYDDVKEAVEVGTLSENDIKGLNFDIV